jgi:hypothetical protein
MEALEKGHQSPGVSESTSGSLVSGLENGGPITTVGTAAGNHSKKAPNDNDQELQVPDARDWNMKYKLFVSLSAICAYFVM